MTEQADAAKDRACEILFGDAHWWNKVNIEDTDVFVDPKSGVNILFGQLINEIRTGNRV